jgi:hypothetical protein
LAIAATLKQLDIKTDKYNAWARERVKENLAETQTALPLMESLDVRNEQSAALIRAIASGSSDDEIRLAPSAIELAARSRPTLLSADFVRVLMRTRNAEIRIATIHSVGLLPKREQSALWRAAIGQGLLADSRKQIRNAVLFAIKAYPLQELQQFVISAFQDEDPAIRSAALSTLTSDHLGLLIKVRRLSPPPPVHSDPYWSTLLPVLRTIATSDSMEENRQLAVRILAADDPDEEALVSTLSQAAHDPSPAVATEAVSALGNLGFGVWVPEILSRFFQIF